MRVPIDLRGIAPAGQFQAYPAGEYTLRVAETSIDTSKQGNPVLRVTFQIIDGPSGSEEFRDRKLPRSYALTENARLFLKRFLVAAGIGDEFLAADGSFDDEMLINRVIRARLSIRPYQGRDQNDIEELVDDGAPQGGNGSPQYAQPQPAAFQPPPAYQPPQAAPAMGYPPQQYAPPAPPAPTGFPQQQYAPPPPPPPPRAPARGSRGSR